MSQKEVPRLTREQAAILGAFTGILMGPFEDMHKYVEKIMGRPVQTFKLAFCNEEIKALAKKDFLALCPEDDDDPDLQA